MNEEKEEFEDEDIKGSLWDFLCIICTVNNNNNNNNNNDNNVKRGSDDFSDNKGKSTKSKDE